MRQTARSELLSAVGRARVTRTAVVTVSALLLFASPGLAVVVPFGPESVITNTADGAYSIHAADLDADGDVDILSASRWDNTVAWYESDGAIPPAFTEHVIKTDAWRVEAVYAADINRDGCLDVLSASVNNDTVAWYENDGATPPSFTEHVITTAADGAKSVHAADMDGDGDVDVLSASCFDDTIAWYENDGASPPSWTEHEITTAVECAQSVHAADVDGDGDVDVLSAPSERSTVGWYENDGGSPPSFTGRRLGSTSSSGVVSVRAADVDGDGDTDILFASTVYNRVVWHENDGASPPAFTRHVIARNWGDASSVHAADVDGDGDMDVLSASPSHDTVEWYENNGASPPGFRGHVITTAARVASAVHAADLDGDGDVDVVSASEYDDTVVWYENRSPHPDLTFRSRRITDAADGAVSVHAADLDADGDTDILSASSEDDMLAWYENDGARPPAFAWRVITAGAAIPQSVHAADVDGDGDTDVLSASIWDDTVAWYENDGARPPGFSERVITTAADGALSVYAADVDGDGDVDVLSASSGDDTVAWYENDGGNPPSFTRHVITATADFAASVHAADVDGDGDTDVLSASNWDDTIAWYENDGGGPPSFTEHVITTLADRAYSVHAADMDGDGDVDVLSASYADDTVAWYENDGASPPAFTQHVITALADGALSVRAADLDSDGDMDVLSASHDDDTVTWYENDGGSPPSFTERVITAAADGATSVQAADVNRDGHVDILSTSNEDDSIRWYENRPDVAVILPVEGDSVDCGLPRIRLRRPQIVWNPGPYDRFRVQISWDPTFAKGTRITSGRELLKSEAWRPRKKAWRKACKNATPYLYIRVFGLDVNIRNKRSPLRKVRSDPIRVEPVY